MGQKLIVGPINNGQRTDRTAFNIDNDSFPTLTNAYQWRGRVKRKRGTVNLGRLTRFFNSTNLSYSLTSTIALVSGAVNILTGFNLQSTGNIVPGSVTIRDTTASITYTDLNKDGTLQGTPSGSGTINYATGNITIVGGGTHNISAIFTYYPTLVGLGWEDFSISNDYAGNIAFDEDYAYNVTTDEPPITYDVSFYKNPPTSGSYTTKTTVTPTSWNGKNYQQFWSTNYFGSFWATNGVTTPFSSTNVGMQYANSTGNGTTNVITYTSNTSTTLTVSITNCPLIVGDFVFANEWTSGTASNAQTLNFQTGFVTSASPNTPTLATKTIVITFPNANIASDTYTPGILQYLTNRSDITVDCIRWYDGDPTNGGNPPVLNGQKGWVNFMPPLSEFNYSIAGATASQYYLVGAKIISQFKDRLLFFSPVIQDSNGDIIYLLDTVIFSGVGTPFYTTSFQGNVTNPSNIIPILVPDNQTAFPAQWFEDQTGFGGYQSSGLDQEITTVGPNQDVLIVGYSRFQQRLVFTGNDAQPFLFYTINSELGSGSTFSSVIMDKGILSRGSRGYIITSQVDAERLDLDIPDQVFETSLTDNGSQRICAIRDFINEWVYFTYPTDNESVNYIFPNQTLIWNYRDNSWAIFDEVYTTYGLWRARSNITWNTLTYTSWLAWDDSWDSGEDNNLNPDVIGLNQQSFIMKKDEDTSEGSSLSITSFTGSVVNIHNHCLNPNDFIQIQGCIGTIGQFVNGQIFQVQVEDVNNITISPDIGTGTYFGGGTVIRMYAPLIMTKQFPVDWGDARKIRLGPQQYLFSSTPNAQITLLIFLSQNSTAPYNIGSLIPNPNTINSSLIYSNVLYTCPESTNLGLTPANINLNMLTAPAQDQIWHRMNTSLIGDTVQIGFTLSDAQMFSFNINGFPFTVTGATNAYPCVLTCASNFNAGDMIQTSGVFPDPNNGIYQVISSDATTVTINVDSTSFGSAFTNGTATSVAPVNQFAEIELHSFILDVNPSMLLA